jgi:alkylhydroperoxidase family enzyme
MSVRRAVARPAEVDDLMDEVRVYERSTLLPEHQKAALRFTDAFLAYPNGLDEEARKRMLAHFSTKQIVELTFKLLYWSCNKALIALGIDGPADPEHLTSFHYDELGAFILDPQPA